MNPPSLQVDAFITLYEYANPDIQRETIETLLKTNVGKEILRQIKVDAMLDWFKNPIAHSLVRRCIAAQNLFLTLEYSSGWENMNTIFNTITNEHVENVNNNWVISVYISDDSAMVCICFRNYVDNSDITVETQSGPVLMKYTPEFNPQVLIDDAFDPNNLYMSYDTDYQQWWVYCREFA
jgi:hypothetical protein